MGRAGRVAIRESGWQRAGGGPRRLCPPQVGTDLTDLTAHRKITIRELGGCMGPIWPSYYGNCRSLLVSRPFCTRFGKLVPCQYCLVPSLTVHRLEFGFLGDCESREQGPAADSFWGPSLGELGGGSQRAVLVTAGPCLVPALSLVAVGVFLFMLEPYLPGFVSPWQGLCSKIRGPFGENQGPCEASLLCGQQQLPPGRSRTPRVLPPLPSQVLCFGPFCSS